MRVYSNEYRGRVNAYSRRILTMCVTALLPKGYAIGGLAGGEDKASFWRVVAHVRPSRARMMGFNYWLFPYSFNAIAPGK